jgi:hypothetical protein
VSATSWRFLLVCGLVAAALGYALGELAYGDLPSLTATAPITLALVAAVEIGVGSIVRERLQGRSGPSARPLHPEQVARAAVLAKASSPTGAVFAGGYAGLLAHLVSDGTQAAMDDRPFAGAAVATALALVGAALFLERCCRLPEDPRDSA